MYMDKRHKRRANVRGKGCVVKRYVRTSNDTVLQYKALEESLLGSNLSSMKDAMTRPRIDNRYAHCKGKPQSQRTIFEPKEVKG